MTQIIIGRKEKADFPDFGLKNILVKIDSGAYTSSIDCQSVELIEEDGNTFVEVQFLNSSRTEATDEKIRFSIFKSKKVKSSTGKSEVRYFIPGRIILFNNEYNTYFSLSKRSGMKAPVLLGRKLLNKNFLIDTNHVYLSNNLIKK